MSVVGVSAFGGTEYAINVHNLPHFFIKRYNDGGRVRLGQNDSILIETKDVSLKSNNPIKVNYTFIVEDYDDFCLKAVRKCNELSIEGKE